ncbi:kelch repeat and BTB domain-containing protein 2-like [Branchiostoma floridae]|uniref:Kelch repeat and BTB domain-containing protein 2-like n=1 Tax=Branchiostoma floridae TaxID=7739 RepID=A0A9J7L9F9_BRAFL|nr:kelch repeat and BTB domain-containing protein 2-like [Branchiostoma floridae]
MAAAEHENHARAVRPCSYYQNNTKYSFFDTIGDLQKAGVLQDVVLEVEGRQFPCHRLVLSARSPYFRAMFTSDMAESRQKTVVLQDMDADVFEEILSYIYSGTLHVSLDKVQPLYQAADLLQLDYVRDTCSSYMAMNVDCSTCVDLYQFADFFSIDKVQNRSLHFICRFFSEVSHTEEFYSLSANQLTEIISNDNLDVKEETTVWEAVVRWVQHSRKDRLHHLPSILPHIRFNLLTSDDTAAILEHPLVKENAGSSEMRSLVGTSSLKGRVGMDAQEMVLLFRTIKKDTMKMLCMNPRSDQCIKFIYTHAQYTVSAATVTSNNDIYILIEESNQQALFRYIHLENVWEKKSSEFCFWDIPKHSLEDPEFTEYLVEVDGLLYYFAVHVTLPPRKRRKRIVMVLKKYQCSTGRWQDCSNVKPMPTHDEHYFNVAVPCGKHLYLITNTEMHRYDPSQDSWCKLTPQQTIPYPCTAVAMGTEIFCMDATLWKMVVYDVEADSWHEVQGWCSPNENPRHNPKLFVYEGQLHVLVEFHSPSRRFFEGSQNINCV